FLDDLLGVLPNVTVERRADAAPANGFDLAVYDGVDVPADPGAPFLAIAPPKGLPTVPVRGNVSKPAVTLVRSEDALLDGLDLSHVAIARAQRVQPETANTLVGAEGAP